jgi:hypothetical protein
MEKKTRVEKVIVPAMPSIEAEESFKRWAEDNKDVLHKLGPNDLVVDYIRGPDGKDLRQYRIFIGED